METKRTSPAGPGWEPWTAGATSKAQLWVNEERCEILIQDGGCERRLTSADPTTFALEVADLERYYDAAPATGTRDSVAILSSPLPRRGRRRASVNLLLSVARAIAQRIATAVRRSALTVSRQLRQPARRLVRGLVAVALALALVTLIVSIVNTLGEALVAGMAATSTSERDAWITWANRRGSEELKSALREGRENPELFRNDIAVAITPPVSGTERCAEDVRYGGPLLQSDRALDEGVARIRMVSTANSTQFPDSVLVAVDPPAGCYFPTNDQTGICVPVTLHRGGGIHYSVKTCYVLSR